MNFDFFTKTGTETPNDVPYLNLLSNSLTANAVTTSDLKVSNSFEVKDFKSTGLATFYAVDANDIQTQSLSTALIGSSPTQYSSLQYFMCERGFDLTEYSIPQPAINTWGAFKGPVVGLGTTPQNYGSFELEYTMSFTTTAINDISIVTFFGSSGFGQCDIKIPVGTSLLTYKLHINAVSGSNTTQAINFYSTINVYSTTFSADFNEGGSITLNDLVLPMRPLFNIRSNQLPTAWSAVRRNYVFYKV